MPILLLISLGVFSVGCGCRKTERKDAPDFVLKHVNGGDFRLSSLKGKVLILNFWATWCSPCRDEIPDLIALQKEYEGKGLVVVGVALDGRSEAVKSFVEKWGINYPIVLADEKTTKDYGILGIPVSFIIDREGNIMEKHIGRVDRIALEKKLGPLLVEQHNRDKRNMLGDKHVLNL